MMNPKDRRLKKVIFTALLLVALCLTGVLLSKAGFGIPCVFHKISGLECPGCGITRMVGAFLEGNLSRAWRYNPFTFLAAPILLVLMLRLAARYIRSGQPMLTRKENLVVWVLVVCAVIFGIMRNMAFYPY